jgi:hypothetical protein
MNLPRVSAELLLDIFSYADRPSLVALSLVDLTFFQLGTPLMYRIAHTNDLPLPDTLRIPRLAELLPSFALSSVWILHITFFNDGPSPEIRGYVYEDLDDMEDNLTRAPSGPRVDKAGRPFWERIEITLEDDGPEWDEEAEEPYFWRARRQGWDPGIEVGEVAEEEEVPDVSEDWYYEQVSSC